MARPRTPSRLLICPVDFYFRGQHKAVELRPKAIREGSIDRIERHRAVSADDVLGDRPGAYLGPAREERGIEPTIVDHREADVLGPAQGIQVGGRPVVSPFAPGHVDIAQSPEVQGMYIA
jgi:hypothetical protein